MIIAVASQPVPGMAAASIVCALAGDVSQRPHGYDGRRRGDAPARRRLRAELRVPRRERAVS